MAKRFAGGRSFNDLPPQPPPPPDQLVGIATGRATVGGTLTLTPPTGAGVIAGRASGLGSAVGALTLTAPPPPPGSAFYINPATGNNANSGAIGAPWFNTVNIIPSRVPAGSTIFFARGQQHLRKDAVSATMFDVPQNNITIDAYGSGARPLFYGWQDIKGTTGDWTQGATNIWGRAFGVYNQTRYRFKVNDEIYTLPVASPATLANAVGKWGIVQGPGTGTNIPSTLYVFSVGNPATTFSTIEISTHTEWCIRGDTKTGFAIKNIDITGWRGALWLHISGLLIEDVSIYGLARRACHTVGNGSAVIRRFEAYKCGFHVIGPQAPSGSHGLYFGGVEMQVIVDGARTWECGEDGIQLGGSLSTTSHVLLDGRNWRSFSAMNRENPLDIKDGNCTAIHWQFHSANEGCITMQGTSKKGHYVDCCMSQMKAIAALFIQEIQTELLVDRCMVFAQGSEVVYLAFSGGRNKIMSSVLIGHTPSTAGLIFLRHSDLDLVHTTLAQHSTGGGPGLNILKAAWPVSVLTITKLSGPDGEGNITYNARISDTQVIRNWPEGGYFEFTGLSGASAPLNGFTIQTFNVTTAVLFSDNALFKVPSSLGLPDTINLTGGSLWSIPRLRTFVGSAIISGDKPLTINSLKSLPDATYGAAYLRDRLTPERMASTKFDDVTEVFYTGAQVKAASGAGSLIAATGGKIGGPANRTDFATGTDGLRRMNVSSIVVTSGIAVVNFATPHGFAGDKVCIFGAVNTGGTPAMLADQASALSGCHFFRENSTTQIEFDALPWVIDQTATGTITATDGQLLAGSAGLGTHVQTSVAVHGVTTDFHNKAFPAAGAAGNFGAIAP